MSHSTTTLHELKDTLWEAANILRGSAVDRTDWKGYILPLLFFKRISDVWDEETAEAAEIYGGRAAAESTSESSSKARVGGLIAEIKNQSTRTWRSSCAKRLPGFGFMYCKLVTRGLLRNS